VTFVDNHDTGSTQAHWPFPANRIMWGYAYILTHPGTPCVFWDHLFDWGAEVQAELEALLAARQRAGVSTRSEVKILKAVAGCYAAQVGDGLWMKIGKDSWEPKEAVELAASGPGYAVWLEATPQAR
jgi:alpha-amylase